MLVAVGIWWELISRDAHPLPAGPGWCPASSSRFFSFRENVLVLDIFFEALNYEAVEQKAAYEVSELLGVY